jgi:NAD(P)-dependent dehydrogenase (short-subunit alcohol dehydrogenase family)
VLKGKTALVTGATSGIGPGIAEAFARDGVNLIVNGFGEAAEIERLCARLADTYRVKVKYDGADAEQGITVNAICPGYVRTPLVEKQIFDTAKARGITEEQAVHDVLLAGQPTKKFVVIEELAIATSGD